LLRILEYFFERCKVQGTEEEEEEARGDRLKVPRPEIRWSNTRDAMITLLPLVILERVVFGA
jgi:hypothetical protein